MKARVLFTDLLNRWKQGDIGEVIENTFDKYDYCINFGVLENVEFLGKTIDVQLVYFFYKHEIELLKG